MDAPEKRRSLGDVGLKSSSSKTTTTALAKQAPPSKLQRKLTSSTTAHDATKQLAAMLSTKKAAKQQGSVSLKRASTSGSGSEFVDLRESMLPASAPVAEVAGRQRQPYPCRKVSDSERIRRSSISGWDRAKATFGLRNPSLAQRRQTVSTFPSYEQETASLRRSDSSGSVENEQDEKVLPTSVEEDPVCLTSAVGETHDNTSSCTRARAEVLYGICFNLWCKRDDDLTLQLIIQTWLSVVVEACTQKRVQERMVQAVAGLDKISVYWSSRNDALSLFRVVRTWRYLIRVTHFWTCTGRQSVSRVINDHRLVMVVAIRAWYDFAISRCKRGDDLLVGGKYEFQLRSFVFRAWSGDIQEIRKGREQLARSTMFLQSFADEQSLVVSLRGKLDALREDLLSRERDLSQREIEVRQDIKGVRAQLDAANEREQTSCWHAEAEEQACRTARQELADASFALSSLESQHHALSADAGKLTENLAASEEAASRDALLVVNLRDELQALRKQMDSEAKEAAKEREELTSCLKRAQSDMNVVRDQATSQTSSFMHLASENTTLRQELQELRDAEAEKVQAHTAARAELQKLAVDLEMSEKEFQLRSQKFDAYAEDREHRNTIVVKAVQDQAEQQSQEYMRLFQESQEQQQELALLQSKDESTQALKKELEILKAHLDQRECDLGNLELELNLRERRVLAQRGEDTDAVDLSQMDESKTTLLEDSGKATSPVRRRPSM